MKVNWSDEATDEYVDTLKWLDEKFGVDTALKFMDKVAAFNVNVSKNPLMYPASLSKKRLRKAVINKRAVIFYYVGEKEITITNVFDTRNPRRGK